MRSRASHSGAISRRGLREAASRKTQLRPIARSWPPTMGNEFKEGRRKAKGRAPDAPGYSFGHSSYCLCDLIFSGRLAGLQPFPASN